MNRSEITYREYWPVGTLRHVQYADGSGEWYWPDGKTLSHFQRADGSEEGYWEDGETLSYSQYADGSKE